MPLIYCCNLLIRFYDTFRNFSFIFLKLCMSKKQKQSDLKNIFNHGVIDFAFSQILKHNAIYVTKISFFITSFLMNKFDENDNQYSQNIQC